MCISKAAVFTHSCVCHILGPRFTPDRCLLMTCQSNPHTMLLILSVSTVDWLVEGTLNVAKVRILSLAFHKQFPPLQKGHIFISFSGGLEGYRRSLKGAELCAFNLPTHTHFIWSQTIVFLSPQTHWKNMLVVTFLQKLYYIVPWTAEKENVIANEIHS